MLSCLQTEWSTHTFQNQSFMNGSFVVQIPYDKYITIYMHACIRAVSCERSVRGCLRIAVANEIIATTSRIRICIRMCVLDVQCGIVIVYIEDGHASMLMQSDNKMCNSRLGLFSLLYYTFVSEIFQLTSMNALC